MSQHRPVPPGVKLLAWEAKCPGCGSVLHIHSMSLMEVIPVGSEDPIPLHELPVSLDALGTPVRACLRCRCTEAHACHDRRLHTPCAWSHIENVCSACLTEPEFEVFLDLHPELKPA